MAPLRAWLGRVGHGQGRERSPLWLLREGDAALLHGLDKGLDSPVVQLPLAIPRYGVDAALAQALSWGGGMRVWVEAVAKGLGETWAGAEEGSLPRTKPTPPAPTTLRGVGTCCWRNHSRVLQGTGEREGVMSGTGETWLGCEAVVSLEGGGFTGERACVPGLHDNLPIGAVHNGGDVPRRLLQTHATRGEVRTEAFVE